MKRFKPMVYWEDPVTKEKMKSESFSVRKYNILILGDREVKPILVEDPKGEWVKYKSYEKEEYVTAKICPKREK